jgi:hypothetical protein
LTYQQLETMNSATLDLNSESIDMSDYGEALRWAESTGGNPGIGDAIYDADDAEALRSLSPRS